MRWGLVPYWAKDIRVGFSTINAMAETIDTKPVFREAFKRRRCLVPVEAYYEWKKLDAKTKQPYAFALAEGRIGARRPLGNVEIAGRRGGAQLYDRDDRTERAVRGDS
jgi:hypothetical protein